MRKENRWLRLCLCVFAAGFFLTAGAVASLAQGLSNDLCKECHEGPPQAIQEAGGKHKTAVGCTDCHVGHPPKVADNIPECSMCHQGEAHFQLENCMGCHVNPHKPLNLNLSGDLKAACLTCHQPIGTQLQQKPSAHTELYCNSCHMDTHGYIPECLNCHGPHSDEMGAGDCSKCHQNAHQPKGVTYDASIKSSYCASCHGGIYETLQASQYKHSQLACATCHQDQHGMIPTCASCHGEPHPQAMVQAFEGCLDCHLDPHDLYK